MKQRWSVCYSCASSTAERMLWQYKWPNNLTVLLLSMATINFATLTEFVPSIVCEELQKAHAVVFLTKLDCYNGCRQQRSPATGRTLSWRTWKLLSAVHPRSRWHSTYQAHCLTQAHHWIPAEIERVARSQQTPTLRTIAANQVTYTASARTGRWAQTHVNSMIVSSPRAKYLASLSPTLSRGQNVVLGP